MKVRPNLSRQKGQALVLVALCMLVLIALVGLAIDGGSMLEQRREAQNASDGAALAGTRILLTYYSEMIRLYPDHDENYGDEQAIRRAINDYAALNGVVTTTLQAYFVNDDKQIITVNRGFERGGQPCGVNQARGPCQVGENGVVPFALGAKGIDVRSTAETDSFFMGLIGWDKVRGSANATAFMGPEAIVDNINLAPIGLFTSTRQIEHLIEGNHYQLIDADLEGGSGNWGWINFNGYGDNRPVVQAWLLCGFNPSLRNQLAWNEHCADYREAQDVQAYGPTLHYPPQEAPADWIPQAQPQYPYYIRYGPNYSGWWLIGSSGTVRANCRDFKRRIDDAGEEGVEVLFPLFDRVLPGGGQSSYYHVRVVVAFRIINHGGRRDVSCNPYNPPTPTPCIVGTPCPTPVSDGGRTQWRIEGDFVRVYSTGTAGRHGDIREYGVGVVFLDR